MDEISISESAVRCNIYLTLYSYNHHLLQYKMTRILVNMEMLSDKDDSKSNRFLSVPMFWCQMTNILSDVLGGLFSGWTAVKSTLIVI